MTDLMSGYDFTTWTAGLGAVNVTANSFEAGVDGNGYVYGNPPTPLTVGEKYRLYTDGAITPGCAFDIRDADNTPIYLSGFGSRSFTAERTSLMVRMYSGAGGDVLTFTEFRCETIVDRPTYIIGDSFTANGSADTELGEITGMTVTPSGVAGQALHGMADRFDADIVANNPEIVIIQGGVNNLAAAVSSPLASMQASIQSMVAAARTAKILPILVNVAPWSHNQYWTAGRQTWTEEYNTWLQSYAAGMGLQYIDIYTALAASEGSSDLAAAYDSGDGLHPNAAGYVVIGELYANAVDALISVTAPNNHISVTLENGENYTAVSDLLTAGDTITFTGVGGDIDLSGLAETAGPIKVLLAGYINSFTGKTGVTFHRWEGGGGSSLVIGGAI